MQVPPRTHRIARKLSQPPLILFDFTMPSLICILPAQTNPQTLIMIVLNFVIFLISMTNYFPISSEVREIQTNPIHSRFSVTPIIVNNRITEGRPRQPRPSSQFHYEGDLLTRQKNFSLKEPIPQQNFLENTHKLNRTASGYITSQMQRMGENGNSHEANVTQGQGKQKIGERIRKLNKSYENRQSLGQNNESNVTVFTQGKNGETQEETKMKEFKEWVTVELNKVNLRITNNEQQIKNIDFKLQQKIESSANYQRQELNRTMALVQKTGNRDESKKIQKAIEQLRQNILDAHKRINEISNKKDPTSLTNIVRQNALENEIDDMRTRIDELVKRKAEKQDINSKIKKIEQSLEQFKKGCFHKQTLLGKIVSSRKCQGATIALTLEERGTSSFNQGSTSSPENCGKLEIEETRTSKLYEWVYYLDSQGYLLDSNKFYLLNEKQETFKLAELELELLRTHGLM